MVDGHDAERVEDRGTVTIACWTCNRAFRSREPGGAEREHHQWAAAKELANKNH